ncbi:MAG: hypothetical protein ACLUNX_04495 [Angelakisella sp.]
MTEKQIGGNGMAKRQPTVLRVPENGAGIPFWAAGQLVRGYF